MSKELTLTSLEIFNNLVERLAGEEHDIDLLKRTDKEYLFIEKELKRLEEHDEIFKKYDLDDIWLEPALHVIKNHFPIDAEIQLKKLKALDIIKKKLVCLKAIHLNGKVEEYNTFVDLTNSSPYHLTKEEFDLLKNVLL